MTDMINNWRIVSFYPVMSFISWGLYFKFIKIVNIDSHNLTYLL